MKIWGKLNGIFLRKQEWKSICTEDCNLKNVNFFWPDAREWGSESNGKNKKMAKIMALLMQVITNLPERQSMQSRVCVSARV
jgi:hypothetical protein